MGESWQVPHVPVNDAGIPVTSLIPATPEIVIGFELNMACPLAMLARAVDREFFQASYKLKIFGLNGAPVGLNPKLAGKESLMPMKNSCEANACGPQLLGRCAESLPDCRLPVQFAVPSRRSRYLVSASAWEARPGHVQSWHPSPDGPSLPTTDQYQDR